MGAGPTGMLWEWVGEPAVVPGTRSQHPRKGGKTSRKVCPRRLEPPNTCETPSPDGQLRSAGACEGKRGLLLLLGIGRGTPFLVHREGMGTLSGTARPWLTGCLQGGWAWTGCTLWNQRQAGLGGAWCCAPSHVCALWHRRVHTSAGPYVEVEETWWARGSGGPWGARVPRGTLKTLQ